MFSKPSPFSGSRISKPLSTSTSMASASNAPTNGSSTTKFAGAGSSSAEQPSCFRNTAPTKSPPTNEEKASPSASNAETPLPSTTRPDPAASSPKHRSSATASGSPPSPTPMATNSNSPAPPPPPKKPSIPTTSSYPHPPNPPKNKF